MYDVHYFACEYCGAHFDEEDLCRRHELNHRYKKAIPTMGHIFIKTDNCDELKEYSAEYDAYDINTLFVSTSLACNFMQSVFEDECVNSPWDMAGLAVEPGWYYINDENSWHCLEQDIADLSAKATTLYLEMRRLESEN